MLCVWNNCRNRPRIRNSDGLRLGSINNAEGMGYVSDLPEHRTRPAVPFLRKLNGPCYRFWLNVVPGDNMHNVDLDKHHRVIFYPYTHDMHSITGHLLALLAQNRDDIHPGTDSQAN